MKRRLMLALGTAFMLVAPVAEAATLRIAATVDGGVTNVIACDQNVCGAPNGVTIFADLDPAVGSLTTGPANIGGLTTDTTNNVSLFGPPVNLLSSSGVTATNTTGATITANVVISATDFTPQALEAFTSGSGTWSVAAVGSSVAMRWYNDPANAQGAETAFDTPGTLIDSFLATAPGAAPFSFAHNGGPFAVNDLAPFSMTLAFDLTLTPGDSLISRGQAEIKPVAAQVPTLHSGVLLWLGALLVGGTLTRRRG